MNLKENVQKWLKHSINDPVIEILRTNSNLTRIQLETLLIDVLSPYIRGKELTMEEKARLRLLKAGVSRGAFNRTLRQARRNVIQSIYTIFLLGYLGIFEDTRLTPYLEVANKLQSYVSAYKDMWENSETVDEHLRIVGMLREQLEESLRRLSRPREL